MGWGVIDRQGGRLVHVASGTIHTKLSEDLPYRLAELEVGLVEILQAHAPTHASVETLFFHKDAQAAAKLGHARGVVLLVLQRFAVPIAEYQPARVKRTLAGGGQADKRQVALMVRAVLDLATLPGADATDALALAITHTRIGGYQEALRQAGGGRGPAEVLLAAERRIRRARLAQRRG